MEGRVSVAEGVADEEKGGTGGGNLLPEVSIFSDGLRCVYGNSRPPPTEGSFPKAKGNPHATTISTTTTTTTTEEGQTRKKGKKKTVARCWLCDFHCERACLVFSRSFD